MTVKFTFHLSFPKRTQLGFMPVHSQTLAWISAFFDRTNTNTIGYFTSLGQMEGVHDKACEGLDDDLEKSPYDYRI